MPDSHMLRVGQIAVPSPLLASHLTFHLLALTSNTTFLSLSGTSRALDPFANCVRYRGRILLGG